MATRFAGLKRAQRLMLVVALLVAIAVLAWVALQPLAGTGGSGVAGPAEGDLVTYQRIIERVRGGEGYYAVAHEVLVADGYGTRSVFNWRTPAWPVLLANLPVGWGQALLGIVGLAGLLMSYVLARRDGGVAPAALALVAVGGSLAGLAVPSSVVFSEVAAGTLLLFSVAAYGLGWRWAGLAAGLAALFLRELAAPYVVVAAVLALRERRWREVGAWVAGGLLYAGYFGWHWWSVAQQITSDDQAYPDGWLQFGGIRFLLSAVGFNGLWSLAPGWLAAVVLPVGTFGLWAWRGGTLALAATVAYLLLLAAIGKPFNYYWGALFTPLLMLGVGWGLYAILIETWHKEQA